MSPHNLRILWAVQWDPHDHVWDLTDNPEDRRLHWEMHAQLCQDEGGVFLFCDPRMVPQAVREHQIDIAIFVMPACDNDEGFVLLDAIHQGIEVLHAHRIPAATILDDAGGEFLYRTCRIAVAFTELLQEFDAIAARGRVVHQGIPYLTDTPVYLATDMAEACVQMQDRPYPEGERDLIAVVRCHRQCEGAKCRGNIHNYVVLKRLLEEFPGYKWFSVGPVFEGQDDEYVKYLGLDRLMLPPAREFRPWGDLLEHLSRTRLGIHLEGMATRGNFVFDCAACGVPCVTTRDSEAGMYLYQGKQLVEHPLCFGDALALAREYLTDPMWWELESRRLFAFAQTKGTEEPLRILRYIIAKYHEEHPCKL